MAAKVGEMNHDITMKPIFVQLRFSKPMITIPPPRSDPMTACVPDTGIPFQEANMTKANVQKQTENIILSEEHVVVILKTRHDVLGERDSHGI